MNAILDGWEDVEQAVRSATNSYGSAEKENEAFMNGIQGRLNQFKTEFQQMAKDTINGDFVKGLVSIGTELLKLINAGKAAIPILIAIASIIGSFKFKTVSEEIGQFIAKLFQLKLAEDGASIAFHKLKLGMASFTSLISVGVIAAITIAIKLFDHFNKAIDRQREKVENLKSEYQSLTSELESMQDEQAKIVEKIQVLSSDTAPTLADKAELSKLKETNAQLEKQIKLKQIAAQQKQDELDQEIIKQYNLEMVETKNRESTTQFQVYTNKEHFVFQVPEKINTETYLNELIAKVGEYNQKLAEGVHLTEQQQEEYEKFKQELADIGVQYGAFLDQYKGDNVQIKQHWQDVYDAIYQTIAPTQYQLDEFKKVFNSEAFADAKDQLLALAQAGNLDSSIINDYEELQDVMARTGLSAEDIVNEIDNMVVKVGEGVPRAIKNFDELRSATNSIVSSAEALSKAFKEQADYGSLSASTIMSIVDAGYAAALAIDTETNAVVLNAEMYKYLLKVKLNEQKQELLDKRQETIDKIKAEQFALYGLAETYEIAARAKTLYENTDNLEAVEAQLAIIDGLMADIDKITAGTYSSSYSARDAANDIPEAFQKAYSDLQYQRDMDMIDEETYYNRLEQLNNQFFTKGSENWKKYNLEIYKGRQEIPKAFKKAYDEIQYLRETSVINEQEYLDRLYALNEKYNKRNLENWRKYDEEIQKGRQELLEKSLKQQGDAYIKAISKQIQQLQDELAETNEYYDKLIKDKENELKEFEKYYDEQIEILQEQKDALREAADEETRLLNIEKARIALAKAKSQKTKRIYVQNVGFIWDVDQAAVAEAQDQLNTLIKEYDNLQIERSLEKQIKSFEEAKKAIRESIQAEIDKLKELKEANAESVESQIKDLEDLQDKFEDTMDLIGLTLEEHQTNLELLAEATKLSFDEMAKAAEDYAARVEAALIGASKAKSSSKAGGSGGGGSSGLIKGSDGNTYREYTIVENGIEKGWGYELVNGGYPEDSPWLSGNLKWDHESSKELNSGSSSSSIWLKGKKASGDRRIKKAGIYNVNEEGYEAIMRSPAQGQYKFLQEKDIVFKKSATDNLWNFANNPNTFLANQLRSMVGLGSRLQLAAPAGGIYVDKFVFGDINLPSVKNANNFVNELKNLSQDAMRRAFSKK